jgi:hypothetical protein
VRNLRREGTSGWMFCIPQADIERIEAGAWRMESGNAYTLNKRNFINVAALIRQAIKHTAGLIHLAQYFPVITHDWERAP